MNKWSNKEPQKAGWYWRVSFHDPANPKLYEERTGNKFVMFLSVVRVINGKLKYTPNFERPMGITELPKMAETMQEYFLPMEEPAWAEFVVD